MRESIGLLVLIASLILFLGTVSAEDQKSARPTIFNKDTAMLAIFGEYSDSHKGTLIPTRYTPTWDIKNAVFLATSIITATYKEGGVGKGVIAIQRQGMLNGEIMDSHATSADISVYVFSYKGQEWIFEKGKQSVTRAGAHGSAPNGILMKIGRDKYGLLFQGGDIHQGFTNDYAFIISLSNEKPSVVVKLDTGESYNDWAWDGKIDFIEDDSNDFFVLKLTSSGTKQEYREKASKPVNKVVYYAYKNGKYELTNETKYTSMKTLNPAEIYSVGQGETREQSMPTIPRKLLR